MRDRITMDVFLKDLLENPKIRELLEEYGVSELEEKDILDIVEDKLTLKGFFRLMDMDDETQGILWKRIQDIYRESEE